MNHFKTLSDNFRLNEPDTYPRNLRGATIGSVEDHYLFLLCAYDFVKNPGNLEPKLICMWRLFFTNPVGEDAEVGAVNWVLNTSRDRLKKINTKLGLLGKNAIPLLNGSASSRAPLARARGVQLGGAANYNLFTQAIDLGCAALGENNLKDTIAKAICDFRDRALTSEQKTMLVTRYNTLREYYDDQTLIKFGLIYR
jgi:hypothetical protein